MYAKLQHIELQAVYQFDSKALQQSSALYRVPSAMRAKQHNVLET